MENSLNTNITTTKSKRPVSFWLSIIFGVVLAISALLNIILFILLISNAISPASFLKQYQDKRYSEKFVSGNIASANKILLIPIKGIIMSHSDGSDLWGGPADPVEIVKDALKKAETDDNIKAIILEINSPGGSVTASDDIHTAVKRFKKKRPNVSIVAYLGEVAASGGYYVAMSANRVVAHPTSITGSIGVIAKLFNVEGLFQKLGLSDETIKSGDKKDMLSWTKTMTEEERTIMQCIIDEMYERFVNVVVEGRPKLTKEEILALADGRIYTGEQAVKHNLADENGDEEDAFESAKKSANITDAQLVQYQKRHSLYDIFEMSALLSQQNTILNLKNILLEKNTPLLLYLWQVE